MKACEISVQEVVETAQKAAGNRVTLQELSCKNSDLRPLRKPVCLGTPAAANENELRRTIPLPNQMTALHLVRVGSFGQLGHFTAIDACRYPRGSRVVLRTERGLECGSVLTYDESVGPVEGQILRSMTVEDHLLEDRLAQHRHAAFEACQSEVARLALPDVLIDVEPLFDGQTLVFHFLGDSSDQLDELTSRLALAYDAKAEIRRFADVLLHGCGPGCGTEAAQGACATCDTGCAVSAVCRPRTPA